MKKYYSQIVVIIESKTYFSDVFDIPDFVSIEIEQKLDEYFH